MPALTGGHSFYVRNPSFSAKLTICVSLPPQIAATDKEIDELVYQLYDLTEDEIKVMKGE